MTFLVDAKRAELVLDAILDRYKRGAYPYNTRKGMLDGFELPKKLKRGGEAEARFWFFACMLMRGGIDSDTGLKAMVEMYDQTMGRGGSRPFDPRYARKMNPLLLTELLGLKKPDQREKTLEIPGLESGLQDPPNEPHRFAIDWINSAQIVYEQFGGKVLQIADQIADYDDAVRLIRNTGSSGFPGFQYKMVSMICFFWIETGLLQPFLYPPPIDFHFNRIAISTRIVYRSRRQKVLVVRSGELDALQAVLRSMYLDYIKLRGFSTNEVADAVWLLSRSLCKYNPGNMSSKGEYAARSTEVTVHDVDMLLNGEDQAKFERSCKRCPVRAKCVLNVPNAHYYTLGRLETSERIDYTPVDHLFKVSD